MKSATKIFALSFQVITHIIAIVILTIFAYPLAAWYFKARPLFGIDFYNTVSLVTELTKNLVFPAQAWQSSWSGGWPFVSQYPVLHFYAILPFTFFASIIDSTLMWMIVASALNFLGMYFLFVSLSKSKPLAVVLTIGALFSAGVYGALLWGGGLPYYATQGFYPWVFFCIVRFIKGNNRRYFWLAILLSGLSIWGHPQTALIYIVPTSAFLLIFGSSKQYRDLKFKKKIGYVLLFAILTYFIGLPMVYQTVGKALTRFVVVGDRDSAVSTLYVTAENAEVVAFHRSQPWRIYIDTSPMVFVTLGAVVPFALLGFILRPRRQFFAQILPYIFLAGGYVFYIVLYAYDISIYHGGWYRLFWSVPVWLGALTSVLWGEFDLGVKISLLKKIAPFTLPLVSLLVAVGIYIVGARMPFLTPVGKQNGPYWELVSTFSTHKLTERGENIASWLPFIQIKDFIFRTGSEGRAAFSSAYPMGINVYEPNQALQQKLLPQFLKNREASAYRLYSADATFNIGWSAHSQIANARGYLDTPVTDDERGYIFWLDAAVNVDPSRGGSSLVTAFNYPEKVALNHALYLLDWNAIGYFQGGSGSSYSSPINTIINNPTYIKTTEDVDISVDYPIPILHQELKYLYLKKEHTSPIIVGTNATVVGVVSSASGFETVVRSMAATNLNSQTLIPIRLGKYINEITDDDLKRLDLLLLYDYDYTNDRGFKWVEEYLKNGGKVLIDSGVETKESDGRKKTTPEFFPFTTLIRQGMGREWEFVVNDKILFEGVELKNFSPPLFDESEWKVAYPEEQKTRPGVEIWLTNRGKPVLTSQTIGSGRVVWSGLNLFYHVTRYNNLDEGVFLKNILAQVIDLKSVPPAQARVVREIPRKVNVTGQGMKGVLFKEQFYPGWQAKITAEGRTQKAKIYKAGPANPGFMYLPLTQALQGKNVEVDFVYLGAYRMWILLLLSIIISLFMVDAFLFNGWVLSRHARRFYLFIKTKTGQWWEKDEEI